MEELQKINGGLDLCRGKSGRKDEVEVAAMLVIMDNPPHSQFTFFSTPIYFFHFFYLLSTQFLYYYLSFYNILFLYIIFIMLKN